MTQTELAKKIGVNKQLIYKYETGTITNIPSDRIEIIAKELETTPAYLMGWDDTKKSNAEDELFIQLEKNLGLITCETIKLFIRLDELDKVEIRGEMKQMLKAEKYSTQERLSRGKSM